MKHSNLKRKLNKNHPPNYSEKRAIKKEISQKVEKGLVSCIEQRRIESFLRQTGSRMCDWNNLREYLKKPYPNYRYKKPNQHLYKFSSSFLIN
ncbi:MAG: hypothetical protein ACOCUU_03310 [Nanoarchaeota archaeon]